MQNIDQTLHPALTQDWQILGELELTIGLASDGTVHKWFPLILRLLPLHADFTNKVLRSAQETVSRFIEAKSAVNCEHIHLILLAPEDLEWSNQNWGFFRIEKIGSNEATLDHTIEFFLYHEE